MSVRAEARLGQIRERGMLQREGTETLPPRPLSAGGIVLPAVSIVWGAGLLLLCGAALATCWRMIDVHDRQQSEQIAISQQFHARLIDEMRTFTGYSAAAVTEDLCRVRFRLRLPGSIAPPAGEYRVTLAQSPGPSAQLIDSWILDRDYNIIDFGMLPPGRYRLTLEDKLKMQCQYNFDVHPGVAVDRVAHCPRYQMWMFEEESAEFRLQLDWPTEWGSRPIVAVVHLRSGATAIEDWTWHPPGERQFEGSVLLTRDARPVSWKGVGDCLPEVLAGRTVPLPESVESDGQRCLVVPYGCCEVYGLSFVLAGSAESGGFRHLGTFLYDDGTAPMPGIEPLPDLEDIVVLSRACPRQVSARTEPGVLSIPLPEIVVPTVLHQADHPPPGGV